VFPRRLLPDVATTVSSPALYGLLLLGCSIAAAILVHLTFEKPTTQMLRRGVSHALDAVRIRLLLTRRGSVAATSASGDE
jgi:peptidoglycan/LPS O-acetylase OafA/YrhL